MIGAGLLALALAACSTGPLGRDVVEQARSGGHVAFDVVDLNDAALVAVLAHQPPPFAQRFEKYLPPPELKIAVGDTLSVVIWEAAANGLFGNSLTELSLPAGAAAELSSGQVPAPTTVAPVPSGLTSSPSNSARSMDLRSRAAPATPSVSLPARQAAPANPPPPPEPPAPSPGRGPSSCSPSPVRPVGPAP